MKILRRLFGRQSEDVGVSRELDERERVVREQQRRLMRIRHLESERKLYQQRRHNG